MDPGHEEGGRVQPPDDLGRHPGELLSPGQVGRHCRLRTAGRASVLPAGLLLHDLQPDLAEDARQRWWRLIALCLFL